MLEQRRDAPELPLVAPPLASAVVEEYLVQVDHEDVAYVPISVKLVVHLVCRFEIPFQVGFGCVDWVYALWAIARKIGDNATCII